MLRRLLLVVDVLLILVASWLGVRLYGVWQGAPPAVSAPAAGAAAPASPTSGPPATTPGAQPGLAPLSAFAVVAERNLFSPTRTETAPEPPKPAPTAAPPAPPAPKPRLYGVVLGGREGGRAYLEDPRTRKVFGYTVGDAVAESRLERIEPDRVVLRRGGEVFEVLLRDPSKPRPAPAPRAPAASGRPQGAAGASPPQPSGDQPSPEGLPGAVPGARGSVTPPAVGPRRPPVRIPPSAPVPTTPTRPEPQPDASDDDG